MKKEKWGGRFVVSGRKKHIGFACMGFLLMLLLLLSTLWGVSATQIQAAHILKRTHTPTLGSIPPQINNQHLRNPSSSTLTAISVGSNQGNSGNQGVNNGFNQDSGANQGNAISSQRKNIGWQENNQIIHQSTDDGGTGGGSTNISNIGFDQGNSGNQGENNGFNQDNSNNTGNQVNNQGTIIGTQINNQGTDVNNDGSVIQHQVNYLSLLPQIQIHLTLRPRPDLTLHVH